MLAHNIAIPRHSRQEMSIDSMTQSQRLQKITMRSPSQLSAIPEPSSDHGTRKLSTLQLVSEIWGTR
ncbi:hypothetical protein IFR05_003619 [Cadophora sp. M221]|nr:hypothetical protein IFR05_003619 [Cadophora sp. M221]